MPVRVRLLILAALSGTAACAPADPPDGYYDGVTGTDGPTIKSQLTTITNQATTRSYGDARNILQVTDEDPANPANVILTYTGDSIVSTWTNGSTWNREHCWPRSLGVGDSGPDYSDLHMLRPCNPSVNGSRGNLAFGTFPGRWDPDRYGQQFRGEMARVVFYANTRYTYLNIAIIGTQSELVDWHFAQMPDADDRERNDRVQLYQQNRNPYVDRPEWVWPVFGDGPSDASVTIAGSSAVDLGSFIAGGDPISTEIQLDKTGAAPTTYLVSVTGDAQSPAATGYQAGFGRNARSETVTVSLASGLGPTQGTLTVDTTEITSAGPGQGSADPDDMVTFTAFGLEPSLASLDSGSAQSSAVIDLGSIDVGSMASVSVPVFNLAPASLGAALDIDSVLVTGGSGDVFITGAPVLGVAPGGQAMLTLTIEPSAQGTIEASATIEVSDEDIPGETAGELTLTVLARGVNPCPADANGDGIVSPADFNAWIDAFNNQRPECDVNGDGLCNPGDFNAWINAYNIGCP